MGDGRGGELTDEMRWVDGGMGWDGIIGTNAVDCTFGTSAADGALARKGGRKCC